MKVTFDSNVWQPICNPNEYLSDPAIAHFRKIRKAIETRQIGAYLAETTFTLEAFKKADRQAALATYKSKIDISEEEMSDGAIKISFRMAPDLSAHPGNNSFLSDYLAAAIPLGFEVLCCPRIAGFKNPDIKDEYFVKQSEAEAQTRIELAARVTREVESRNAGIALLKEIGDKFDAARRGWVEGIRVAPDAEKKSIAKAFSEWADGDSIAAHVGYGNTHYCTRDQGKSAGQKSILAKENRAWLEQTHRVVFVTPEELSALIA